MDSLTPEVVTEIMTKLIWIGIIYFILKIADEIMKPARPVSKMKGHWEWRPDARGAQTKSVKVRKVK